MYPAAWATVVWPYFIILQAEKDFITGVKMNSAASFQTCPLSRFFHPMLWPIEPPPRVLCDSRDR